MAPGGSGSVRRTPSQADPTSGLSGHGDDPAGVNGLPAGRVVTTKWNHTSVRPHGTEAAYQRHIYHREKPCRSCKIAHAAKARRLRRQERAERTRSEQTRRQPDARLHYQPNVLAHFDAPAFWGDVAAYRQRQGFTWQGLAWSAGLNQATVYKGRRRMQEPSATTLAALAYVCDLDLNRYIREAA